jgi:hypothetical protein
MSRNFGGSLPALHWSVNEGCFSGRLEAAPDISLPPSTVKFLIFRCYG